MTCLPITETIANIYILQGQKTLHYNLLLVQQRTKIGETEYCVLPGVVVVFHNCRLCDILSLVFLFGGSTVRSKQGHNAISKWNVKTFHFSQKHKMLFLNKLHIFLIQNSSCENCTSLKIFRAWWNLDGRLLELAQLE